MTLTPPGPGSSTSASVAESSVTVSDEGYAQTLGHRHVTMIAIGGAIGVGLFMGTGSRLVSTGPALIGSYVIAGILAFFLMRAIGELIMYRRTSGSFVSYAGEFYGAKGAYVAGWAYLINWGLTGVAELIAIGLYVQNLLPSVHWFVSAMIALVLLVAANLISVKMFGELEFWASIVKVGAILLFLAAGTVLVVTGASIGDAGPAGLHNLTATGGSFFAHGVAPMILVLSGVVFAFNGIEIVGITAGEMKDAEAEVPKAVRTVILRIVVFYIGSVTLLSLLLPSDEYRAGVSPFVTVFEKMGLPWVSTAMTLVVTTAAISSTNSGLYSIGRVFRTMAHHGHAPQWLTRMNARHVPYASIFAIAVFYAVGLVVALLATGGRGQGSVAFDLALETAAIGVIGTWAAIFLSQIGLRRRHGRSASTLPMPGGIAASVGCLIALAGILVLIGFTTVTAPDGSTFPMGLATLASIPVFVVLLVLGWVVVKRRHPELQDDELYRLEAEREDREVRERLARVGA